MLLNPKRGVREYPDEASREMMLAVIDFFESKGLARLKHDDHERVWYQDFLEFVKEKGLFFACRESIQNNHPSLNLRKERINL